MTPLKKSRVVKNRPKFIEEWPYEDGKNTVKSKTKKRKLSEMLGSQWTKGEVERFYEAYRKYGNDWKKVAAKVRNRSSDAVEALYNMTRVYLSLPEGTATVGGLVAIVTDHNILDENVGAQTNNQVATTTRKPHRHCHPNPQNDMPNGYGELSSLQNQSTPSTSDCLSLLRKSHSGGLFGERARAVGKRTPRVPVPLLLQKDIVDSTTLPDKQKSNSVDERIHVAALTLAEASHKISSPQLSQTLGRSRIQDELPMDNVNFSSIGVDGGYLKAGPGNIEADDGDASRDAKFQQTGDFGASGLHKKVLKFQRKRSKGSSGVPIHHDGVRKACSEVKEENNNMRVKHKGEKEANEERHLLGSEGSSEKPLNICSADEKSAVDALQTLAGFSLDIFLPDSSAPSESRNHEPNKSKISDTDERDNSSEIRAYPVYQTSSKLESNPSSNDNGAFEPKETKYLTSSKKQKRKWNYLEEKLPFPNHETRCEFSLSKKNKVLLEEAKTSCASELVPISKQEIAIHESELSSLSVEQGSIVTSLIGPTKTATALTSATGTRTRRKINLQKEMANRFWSPSERVEGESCNSQSDLMSSKGTLSNCLSSTLLRKWCTYEWFYSSIDYPWFARVDFIEYLNHVRLGHIPRLTRVEWSIIRSSLGKPRRLSSHFLLEERRKLEQYRESVRTQYAELQVGVTEGFPTDLARPLSVGQCVIALHPKTRELYDGSILNVDRGRYRIKFDRPELGVEFVKDIDCMPMNLWENMPDDLRQNAILYRSFSGENTSPLSLMNSEITTSLASFKFPLAMHNKQVDIFDAKRINNHDSGGVTITSKHAACSQPCSKSQIQAKEADINALAKLTCALEKKEALLMELRGMNEELSRKQNDGNLLGNSEDFRKHYALVLLHLQEANNNVSSALLDLKQCTSSDIRSISEFSGFLEPCNGFYPYNDAESHKVEIIESSRREAKKMVNTAVQAIISSRAGADCSTMATESLGSKLTGASSIGQDIRNVHHQGLGNLMTQDVVCIRFSDPAAADIPTPKVKTLSDVNVVQMPSELISACIAALLMIQTCAEQQYPPAEVAGILECAVTYLRPRCSENLPIYREIETCMDIIKSQMLALIPTQSPGLPSEVSV